MCERVSRSLEKSSRNGREKRDKFRNEVKEIEFQVYMQVPSLLAFNILMLLFLDESLVEKLHDNRQILDLAMFSEEISFDMFLLLDSTSYSTCFCCFVGACSQFDAQDWRERPPIIM